MPTPLMKSLAKEANKKPKTVEKLWAKSEKIVKQKYEIDDSSNRFYPLVVSVLKNLLGLSKKEKELEEDEGGEMTPSDMVSTTTMGSENGQGALFYPMLGTPVKRIDGPITQVKTTISKSKKKKKFDYDKLVRDIVRKVNEKALKENLDTLMSDAILYYSNKHNDPEEILEQAITSINKRLGLEQSILDK